MEQKTTFENEIKIFLRQIFVVDCLQKMLRTSRRGHVSLWDIWKIL